MTRYDRYQALKEAHRRLGWHLLGDDVSERSVTRAAGIATAWDRIGRLAYPMDGDCSPRCLPEHAAAPLKQDDSRERPAPTTQQAGTVFHFVRWQRKWMSRDELLKLYPAPTAPRR